MTIDPRGGRSRSLNAEVRPAARQQCTACPRLRHERTALRRRPQGLRPPALPAPVTARDPARREAAEGRRGRRAARAAHGRRPARAPAARPPGVAHDRRAEPGGDGHGRGRGALDCQPPGPPARDAAAGGVRGGRRDRHDEGHLLQPAVAGAQVPAGNAAAAAGQVRGSQPLPRAVPRPDRRGGRRRRLGRRDLSGHRRPVVDPDPRARAPVARRRAGGARAAAGAHARARRAARPSGGARRRPLRRPRGRPAAAGLRRAAAAPDRPAEAPRAPARGLAGDAARAAGRAHRALAGRTRCRSSRPPTSARRWRPSTGI